MDKVKVAAELVKIAKSLTAGVEVFDRARAEDILEFELNKKAGMKLMSFRPSFAGENRYEGEVTIRMANGVIMFAQAWVEAGKGRGFENYEITVPSFRITPNGIQRG